MEWREEEGDYVLFTDESRYNQNCESSLRHGTHSIRKLYVVGKGLTRGHHLLKTCIVPTESFCGFDRQQYS